MENIFIILQSVLLGIVEGFTEFLPISSTGHLIIFENITGFNRQNAAFVDMYTYVIQLGAILAIVVLYRGKIIDSLKNIKPQKQNWRVSGLYFWVSVAVACIPGFIAQMLFDNLAETYLFNAVAVAITLFVGGLFLIFAEKKLRNNHGQDHLVLTLKQALIIGCFQCLAIIPGMSRSASTIIGGWVAGLSTVAAAEFSFFLAIPVMFGMSFLKIIKIGGLAVLSASELAALAVGFVVAFLVALVVVDRFIKYL
ncbi:MAG: undecaprenyl-diphosphate phosphatase, partial [Anaerolineae bacterium]|nr:undecaprenyl-diphosphate phosphatase [Anaerolineae bacterium]